MEYVVDKQMPNTINIEFGKGDHVLYIPSHANGDAKHKDCQRGVVSSINNSFVFVKYDCLARTMVTGDEPYTAQATNPNDLTLI